MRASPTRKGDLRRTTQKTSRYVGVFRNRYESWSFRLKFGGRFIRLQGFQTERAAAEARDRVARYLRAPVQLNFPNRRLPSASLEKINVELAEHRRSRVGHYAGVRRLPAQRRR